MSIVTVQIGQCGNQVGEQLFSTIAEDTYGKYSGVGVKDNETYKTEVEKCFFTLSEKGPPKAKAVLVDMEPKVIAQCKTNAKRSGLWSYNDSSSFCQKRGSGNNWAHGYFKHAQNASINVMELLRKEVEKCDHLGGFLVLMSLAGGTGSGVGAYLSQTIRDEFPNSFIANQIVWPYNTGEVIVQNYNAILTLSHLYNSSDAILIFENDHMQKMCTQLMGIKNISFRDINKVICHHLAGGLLRTNGFLNCNRLKTNHLGDVLEHLVSHPDYKLLTMRAIPLMSQHSKAYSSYNWPGLLKHLRQMLVANAAMEEGIDWNVKVSEGKFRTFNKSVANLMFLRGKDIASPDISAFQDSRLYPDWIPPGCALETWTQPRCFHQYEKAAIMLSNSQSPVGPLNHVISKAWGMFSSRAYVHQYTNHGMAEENFLDAFTSLEQVLKNYKDL
ncbi:unnamed protein product [Owenia fusiformis]|uniref:Tubulin delta chain n=1 Tax=Owenia fusiformis TaxID=6347 RepID=A0A8J1TLJ8_OWEFU|nr:unnamed protein product [Owenia fusiformis]